MFYIPFIVQRKSIYFAVFGMNHLRFFGCESIKSSINKARVSNKCGQIVELLCGDGCKFLLKYKILFKAKLFLNV